MAKLKKLSPRITVVACAGGCRATAACTEGCVGCGVCVSVCPFEAIELNDIGVAEVDLSRCVGCGKCVRECPREVISIHDRLCPIVVHCANHAPGKLAREACMLSCIGCGKCARVCPAGAIRVEDNLAWIDETLCLSCGQCAVNCPRHAIVDVRAILTPRRWRTDK